MIQNYYRLEDYETDHTTFGGVVHDYDFGGRLTMQDIINRIESDRKFDKICQLKHKNTLKENKING